MLFFQSQAQSRCSAAATLNQLARFMYLCLIFNTNGMFWMTKILRYICFSSFPASKAQRSQQISSQCNAIQPHFFMLARLFTCYPSQTIEILFFKLTKFVLCNEILYSFYRSSAETAGICSFYLEFRKKLVRTNETPLYTEKLYY